MIVVASRPADRLGLTGFFKPIRCDLVRLDRVYLRLSIPELQLVDVGVARWVLAHDLLTLICLHVERPDVVTGGAGLPTTLNISCRTFLGRNVAYCRYET